jgi:hypothetical protein
MSDCTSCLVHTEATSRLHKRDVDLVEPLPIKPLNDRARLFIFARVIARLTILSILILLFLAALAVGQKKGTPIDAAISFYRLLKEKRYVEGFRHSVYRNAVEGLSPAELQDLEPDFARTFSTIPEKIEARGEKITGQTATVSLKFAGAEDVQEVVLVRAGGEWLVGDQETLALVNAQGRAFFFNARMLVNESEAYETLQRIIGAELIYSRRFEGRNIPLPELIRLNAVPKDIEDGEASGYRFNVIVSADEKSFSATATPVSYGKTGKVSFYADINGVRGDDLKGQPATARSPIHQPK